MTRVLVLGWGNPSRGDDALGPELVRRLEALAPERTGWRQHAFLTDFQLQPEHALDLAQHDLVLFADASVAAGEPYTFSRVQPERDASFTSHALSPSALLAVHRQLFGGEAPEAYLLALRGEAFELGQALSAPARGRLEAALALAVKLLDAPAAVSSLLAEAAVR